MSTQEDLRQAIAILRSRNKKTAGRMIVRVLRSESDNDLAWYWLSVCHQDIAKKKKCLQKARRKEF